MSVIGKKPFVNNILEGLEKTELEALVTMINGSTGAVSHYSLFNPDYFIGDDEKNKVTYAAVHLDDLTRAVETGYLCYGSNGCGLFVPDNKTNNMRVYSINVETRQYNRVYEGLTVDEFRGVLDDLINAGGGGSSMELLWENASPKSGFARQTLTIDGLDEYKMICVIFHPNNGTTGQASTGLFSHCMLNADQYFFCPGCDSGSAWNSIGYRYLHFRGNNKLEISSAWKANYNTSTSVSDNLYYIIPVKIYGIK